LVTAQVLTQGARQSLQTVVPETGTFRGHSSRTTPVVQTSCLAMQAFGSCPNRLIIAPTSY
jgi:hypothetical protein